MQDLLSVRITKWLADGVSLYIWLVASRMAINSALCLVFKVPVRKECDVVCPCVCKTIPLPPVLVFGFVEPFV